MFIDCAWQKNSFSTGMNWQILCAFTVTKSGEVLSPVITKDQYHLKPMKTFFLFSFLFFFYTSYSQFQVNVYAGPSNYYGDIQPKKLTFSQANVVLGAGANVSITNKWSIRGDYFFTKLGADDKKGPFTSRNLNFKTYLQELDLLAEYNFLDLAETKFTPYAFAGIGAFRFSPYTTDTSYGRVYLVGLGTEGQGLPQYPDRKPYKKTQMNIPVGGGFKFALSNDVHFGLEYGLRILFTDYLDDVSKTYVDEEVLLNARGPAAVALAFRGDELSENPAPYPGDQAMRGTNTRKDLYYYGVARLSIQMRWFNNFIGPGGRNGRFGCPSNVL
jgi:hypothetical protein